MRAIGPEIPQPLRPLLREILGALSALEVPGRPGAVHACLAADLPPAAHWPSCLVLVSDLNILAHSDGSDWIRQDTGAPV